MPFESKPDAEKAKAPQAPVVGTVGLVADQDLYLAEDEHTVVEKGDPKARFLLAARGSMIDPVTIAARGLSLKGGKVVQAKPDDEDAPLGPPGRVNEGQLRDPGEPLILAPRTGVLRGDVAERTVHVEGDEVDLNAMKTVLVSNVPPEDDEFRAEVAAETEDPDAAEREAKEVAERAAQPQAPAVRKAAKKSARKGK